MKFELNTGMVHIFSGTYNTAWQVEEYNDDGEELEIEYLQDDLMKSIAEVYQKRQDRILDDLNIGFIKSLEFTGKYYSPREYNFATDELDFNIEVDDKALFAKLDELRDNQEFAKYLKEEYSDRPGFWSWTPNNYLDLRRELETAGDKKDQAISALINFLAQDVLDDIDTEAEEDWQGNGYYSLDYKVVNEE